MGRIENNKGKEEGLHTDNTVPKALIVLPIPVASAQVRPAEPVLVIMRFRAATVAAKIKSTCSYSNDRLL